MIWLSQLENIYLLLSIFLLCKNRIHYHSQTLLSKIKVATKCLLHHIRLNHFLQWVDRRINVSNLLYLKGRHPLPALATDGSDLRNIPAYFLHYQMSQFFHYEP